MERTGRPPGDVDLVVVPRTGDVVREHWLTIAVFTVTAGLAGFGVAATGSVVWLVIGSLCLAGVVLEVLLVRAQAGFGPLLAADADHVWLRTGGFLAPKAVRLDWSEITAVTLRLWHGRRGATARFLAFDLVDGGTDDLYLARRTRRSARVFGAPLAITERRPASFDGAFRALRDLAPAGVAFSTR